MKTCDICDEELADKLWKKSEEWTNLNERINTMKNLKNKETKERTSEFNTNR